MDFGASINYDSQCPEKNHKYFAKIPGRRSKKSNLASEFENQVARRVSEAMIIDEMSLALDHAVPNDTNKLDDTEDNDIITQSTDNATFGKVYKDENNQCIIKWKKKENNSIIFPIPGFAELLLETYNSDEVTFCTEYVRAGTSYRCHPKYGKHGAYYDWMIVRFDDNEYYPCKLIACIPGEENGFEGYDLIIQETTEKLDGGTILFDRYAFSHNLVRIDADCIQGPCFVFEGAINANKISLAVDRENWPDKFF